ncbi:uncharacterized protein LOC132602534 isoform X3 [Lycium barbarum]|uniref:uncharacterized protein LOC132602534 isoform X3 n=1 Tax=Lycium barbarum TaxID=112863 RepID=UPI00293E3849|nr:uncharacterized protein LOC132602534 isoform X3 [Lycium barbarum]
MLGSGSVLPEKMQQPAQGRGMKCCGGTSKKMQPPPLPQGGETKKQRGVCSCPAKKCFGEQGGRYSNMTEEDSKKYIEEGYACPSSDKYFNPDLIPDGALLKHHPDFQTIWSRYWRQLQTTNNMDMDTYPGVSDMIEVWPLNWPNTTEGYDNEVNDLAIFAIQEHNKEPFHIFKYELLKIEKVNARLSGYLEFFVTVKVKNLTLGTVIETFQIHTGRPLHVRYLVLTGKMAQRFEDVYSFLPKGGDLVDSSEEEMTGSESRPFSSEKKPNSAEELLAWQRELPCRFLANEVLWDDNVFIPEKASEKLPAIFHRIYGRYFNQICETEGFDIDIYPGDSVAAMYIPYLDFDKEIGLLMDLAEHAIQDYNNREIDDYKYEVESVEKVNFILAECREFFMTVKVKNLTLRTPVETFQIHAYKGPDFENVVRTCRKKLFEVLVDDEMAGRKSRQLSPAKKPKSAEELLAWQRGLPRRFLSNNEVFWDAEVFIPEGVLKNDSAIFHRIYWRYFSQICVTKGFNIDIYPGDSVAAMYIPYLDFKKKIGLLMDLAEQAIQDYNNREINIFKYTLLKIEKVNVQSGYLEHFMTVKAINLTLGTVIETFQIHTGSLSQPSECVVISCLPKGRDLADSSEEEMAGSESRQFSPEKKPNSAEELLAWQRELPCRFLANEVQWDDNVFIPEDASEKLPAIFHRIYGRYFNQICETEGFDIDIYPGDSMAAMYIPYLDFDKEIGLLMDLAEHAIQDYNNREIDKLN